MTTRQGPRSVLAAAALAVCAALCGRAAADQPATWPYVPPTEQGEVMVRSQLSPDGAAVQMIDVSNEKTIIAQVPYVYLWDDYLTNSAVRPTVELRQQPTGFDLVYTFTNETAGPKPLGRLRVGSMILGPQMTWQDFSYLGEDREGVSGAWTMITRNYPAGWYSPVAVVRNAEYAVGVSLLYPMMEYKHDVRVALSNNGVPGQGNVGWEAIFQFQNFGGEGTFDRVAYANELQPGETRTYVLTVRVTRNSAEWIRTLAPYRDFFLKFYGGVRYARNTEPIIGFATGTQELISDDNPYGFGSWRPDLNGWETFVNGLQSLQGWKNVMVWKPTGHFKNYRAGNIPFQFTSRWLDDPELGTALDPTIGFPSVGASGKNLGFWWGYSANVRFEWDDARSEPLDPDNPEHVRLANRELDLAVQAGATIIGLDTFHPWLNKPWNLTRWIQMMQARHPRLRFVAEPVSFDILHTLVPQYTTGYLAGGANPQTLEDLYPIKQPHMLSNFIVPGSEIWASMMYAAHQYYLGINPDDQMVNDDVARYAALGFTPIMFPPINVVLQNRADQRTADAWHQVVPADLVASYRWNRNYVNSAIVRRADGSMAIIEASNPDAPPTPPAPPPAQNPEQPQGDGGGGMVMGSAPDARRHAGKSVKKSAPKATSFNFAEGVPDQVTSKQGEFPSPGAVNTKSRVAGKARHDFGASRQQPLQPGKGEHQVRAANGETPVAAGVAGVAPRSGGAADVVRVVPSSTPGMTSAAPKHGVASVPQAKPSTQGVQLGDVRRALKRAQFARPGVAAGVVEVER